MASVPAGPKKTPTSLARKLTYSTIVVVVFFGGLELLLWAFWTPSAPKGPPRGPAVGERQFVSWLSDLATTDPLASPLYREDRHLLWSLVPDAQIRGVITHRAPDGEKQQIRITINADGYRGRKLGTEDDQATFRVLCLGDSNFFGYPLDDEHVFPHVLEKKLSRLAPRRRIEVINGGVPGYTIAQGRRLYDKRFGQHRFDVVLLSYLNNDAWPQPQTDSHLFEVQHSFLYPVARVIRHSRLVSFMGSFFAKDISPSDFVPRVPLDDFVQHFESLVDTLRKAKTRVMILDYCAYKPYVPYGRKLRELAHRKGLPYLGVGENVAAQLRDPHGLDPYRHLAERVARRWGPGMLQQHPYLWYFAEYSPEHLNEVGVAWLADRIAPMLLK